MYAFLFDILSDTGHVRITLQLALLLHEKGHEVYYTDTSDSVFTTELLKKGIGRIIYPDDLHFFTPDLVLLDYLLQEKAAYYRKRRVDYIYVSMHLWGEALTLKETSPLLYLAPSHKPDASIPLRQQILLDLLNLKEKRSAQTIIAGLLEEKKGGTRTLANFYKVLKQSCIENSRYQLFLLYNNPQIPQQLFPLPDNVSLFHLMNLPALLPVCDVVLSTGELNTLVECIHAHQPPLLYPIVSKGEEHQHSVQADRLGIGLYREIRKVTPKLFKKHIEEILVHKELLKEKTEQLDACLEQKNRQLTEIVTQLITIIKEKQC